MGNADATNQRWAEMLAQWAIPDELLAAVPASPYFFDAAVFAGTANEALAREVDTPSDAVARDALPHDGSVLDVGVGTGAASLRLGAGHVIGVDSSREMLDAFAQRAATAGIPVTVVEGRWPDVAPETPPADVAVCHHVAYNVADLAAFATALHEHTGRRVVMELTAVHPLSWMAPYWESLHGLVRPDRPTAEDAIAVLRALGFDVRQERWRRELQMVGESGDDQVPRLARRLCVPEDRHDELRQILVAVPPPREREVATLWWDLPPRST